MAESSKRSGRIFQPAAPWAIVLPTGRAVRVRETGDLSGVCWPTQTLWIRKPPGRNADRAEELLGLCTDTRSH